MMITRNKPHKKILIQIACLLFLLAGCSNAGNSNSSTIGTEESKSSKPVSGGEFTYALSTPPDTLDPQASGFAVSYRVLKSIFETLVYQSKDNTIEPWLATEWDISEDQKSYTFKLRDDVTFHDGSKFNAEVVKYNFERILNPKTRATTAASYLGKFKSIEILDDYTIKINLSEPSATFLTLLAHTNLSIVSQEAAEKYGDQFNAHPVGSGPFKFVEQVENDRIVLEKNENYHGGYPFAEHDGPAYLDKLVFKIIPEEATRIGSVQSGQVNAIETVPPQDVVSIKANNQLNILEAATGGLPYTLFINQTTAPWDDVKARQALKAAIDVKTIVNTLYLGTYKRAWSSLAPITFGYDKSLENKDSYDVKKANQLFDELGWEKASDGLRKKDGKTLTLRILNDAINREKRQDISLMVQQQLKEVGVQVELITTNDPLSILKDAKGYDLRGNSRVALDPDDLTLFYHSQKTRDTGGLNLSWIKDKEIDTWLENAAVELDKEKRADLYKQVQQKLIDQVAVIPIYDFPYTVAAAKKVQGLKFDSLGYPLFFDVNLQK
ncbi:MULTISPECIES: ABC transporter substrate-binding protein [Bacillus]|uniref:ABC transporter substrate-binding protein n=3 Tax=Bacillus TaxID=1386 RepID=A0A0M4FTL7_9BACI|nr:MULTISPECIES: ABC transporter substrate-binding protein [Bacillus]ALC83071.1 ABC transporter substrate-binding protein [Bacillus gobiensis]MBP1082115.1 peptide/nickel transport system substrate-binding protein [Bacillus capparidis]MED1096738.1 ABC transporter substrate-binding protein [Bacillus capparidis]